MWADQAATPRGRGALAAVSAKDAFMAMGPNSIGKSYRTAGNEIRTVQSIDDGDVIAPSVALLRQ